MLPRLVQYSSTVLGVQNIATYIWLYILNLIRCTTGTRNPDFLFATFSATMRFSAGYFSVTTRNIWNSPAPLRVFHVFLALASPSADPHPCNGPLRLCPLNEIRDPKDPKHIRLNGYAAHLLFQTVFVAVSDVKVPLIYGIIAKRRDPSLNVVCGQFLTPGGKKCSNFRAMALQYNHVIHVPLSKFFSFPYK